MALSYNVHNSPFTTNAFTFTFDYIDEADVHAIGLNSSNEYVQLTVDTVSTNGTKTATVSDSVSTLNSTYTKVRIYRATSNIGLVDFQSGSRIRETDLDVSYKQALFACQEVTENADASDQRVSIGTDQISNLAITTDKIADDAVTPAKLADTLDLSDHTVTLATGEISRAELAADIIDSTKLADDSVNSEHIVDDAIDSEHLTDGSIDNVHIAAGTIELTTKVTGVLPAANGGTGVSTAIPFTKGFTTTISIPAVDTTSADVAHGLGAVPKLVTIHLVCTTAINGYNVGDIATLGDGDNESDGFNAVADSTNVKFQRDQDIHLVNMSGAGRFIVSSSNFDLVLSCYA